MQLATLLRHFGFVVVCPLFIGIEELHEKQLEYCGENSIETSVGESGWLILNANIGQ